MCRWYRSFEGSVEPKLRVRRLSNSRSTSTPSVEFPAGILALLRMSLKLSNVDREVWNDLVDGATKRGVVELALCRNIEVKVVRNVDMHAMLKGSQPVVNYSWAKDFSGQEVPSHVIIGMIIVT